MPSSRAPGGKEFILGNLSEGSEAPVECAEPVEPQYSVDASKTCVPGSVSDTGDPYVQLHWLVELDQHSEGTVEIEVETPDDEKVTYEKEITETPESSSSFEGEGYASFVHNLLDETAGTYNYLVTARDESEELIYPVNGINGSIDVSMDEINECQAGG
jgi:hypothetical protein